MAVLGDSGALTQRDLTQRTLMDKVAVNRACKVLEERGLAVRTAQCQDGRSHHLDLTDSGRAMHGQIMPLALEMERRSSPAFPRRKSPVSAACSAGCATRSATSTPTTSTTAATSASTDGSPPRIPRPRGTG
jgi:hypothetical protein